MGVQRGGVEAQRRAPAAAAALPAAAIRCSSRPASSTSVSGRQRAVRPGSPGRSRWSRRAAAPWTGCPPSSLVRHEPPLVVAHDSGARSRPSRRPRSDRNTPAGRAGPRRPPRGSPGYIAANAARPQPGVLGQVDPAARPRRPAGPVVQHGPEPAVAGRHVDRERPAGHREGQVAPGARAEPLQRAQERGAAALLRRLAGSGR